MLKNFIFVILWTILSFSFVFADDNKQPQVTYTGRDYENPFKSWLPEKEEIQVITPLIEQEVFLPHLSIEGIVWGGEFPQAIINGSVVRVGDRVEDVEILAIQKSKIKLLYQGSIFFLLANEENSQQ